MPDSYPFTTYSGLLEPKHYKRIGTALWLFLWCISSTTKEREIEGVTWGIVLHGKPIKLSELAEPFDVDEKTVRRWLKVLEKHGYIKIDRAPYGIILKVKNSKKYKERVDKNVHSDSGDRTKMSTLEGRDRTDMSTLRDKNVHSNKDIIKDFITTATTADPNDEDPELAIIKIVDAYCDLHQKLEFHVTQKERAIMNRMIAGGMPVPFIIRVMRQVHEMKKEREEAEIGGFTPPNSFRYYENAIREAWAKNGSITASVPSDSVALGSARKSKQQLQTERLLREIREEEAHEPTRTQEAIFDHQQCL